MIFIGSNQTRINKDKKATKVIVLVLQIHRVPKILISHVSGFTRNEKKKKDTKMRNIVEKGEFIDKKTPYYTTY